MSALSLLRLDAREHSSTERACLFLAKLRFQEHDNHAGSFRLGFVISMIMFTSSPVNTDTGDCWPRRWCRPMAIARM